MSTIGVRELAKNASAIISNIEQTRKPVLITRRGRPVAYILAVDSEEFEDFLLTHAPEFIEGMATANAELATGKAVSLTDTRGDLEANQSPSIR
jgi:prevent-host-death family protein